MKKIYLFNKVIFVLILLILFTSSSFSQKTTKLEKEISNVLSSEFFKSCQIAIDVFDLTSNKSLLSKNEKLLLRPASTLKLLTTSASLLFLNDFQFHTSFFYKGELRDSILVGDIFVVGGLDPDFTSKDLDSVVIEIRKSGIKEIRGNIIADVTAIDSLFWGNGWMWDDDPFPSSPYLSALNINDNSIKVIYEPGFRDKPEIVNTIPKTKFVEVINNSVTKENKITPFKITRDWINRSNKIIVNGELSFNEKPGDVLINIFNPTNYFLTLLKESFEKNKISFNGDIKFSTIPDGVKELFIFNRNLDSIIVNVNKNSDNLSAEMLLRGMSLKYYGKPASAEKGIKLIDSLFTITGMDPKIFKVVDGSGLSFYNLISAEALTQVLKYVYQKKNDAFTKLYNSLPISGVDGTLKGRMKNSPLFKNVRAKTGSISGVSTLSGYLTNKSNHLIAFTIMMQNFTGSSKTARETQDKICEIIYNN
ncbi:MAG: D-alanyl-D-alanine carboxypeptidase/D-alanyl-D-alanine-endopeptidase [Ignavibacteria bacterium]|nr:D-alanyl-D-alanine carboxypeptidase/D-alanyl-D-alanine-endopeptidase [Ignavibacteria bacterium]